jgi:hypothetical protein
MRTYLKHINGRIFEYADAGEGNAFQTQSFNDGTVMMEIDLETYKTLKKNGGEFYKVVDGKVVEKTNEEKIQVFLAKEDWEKNNTLRGIKAQFEAYKEKVDNLEAKIKQ